MIGKLVLGTVQLGIPYGINNSYGKPDAAQANAILDAAREAGITTLDTANAYGDATGLIGNYHRSSGHQFKVISKFHAGGNLEQNIKKELQLLKLSQFEGYLFHSFGDFEQVSDETAAVLTDLRSQQLVGKIGVSIYGNEQFDTAIKSPLVDIIQLPYNLLDNAGQRGKWIEKAKAAGKELHVRSVFLQGLFFMDRERFPQKLKTLLPFLEQLSGIAESEKLSMQELALAYVLQNEKIDKVLIGVDSLGQLQANISLVNSIKPLPASIKEKVDRINVQEKELLSPVNWK